MLTFCSLSWQRTSARARVPPLQMAVLPFCVSTFFVIFLIQLCVNSFDARCCQLRAFWLVRLCVSVCASVSVPFQWSFIERASIGNHDFPSCRRARGRRATIAMNYLKFDDGNDDDQFFERDLSGSIRDTYKCSLSTKSSCRGTPVDWLFALVSIRSMRQTIIDQRHHRRAFSIKRNIKM